MEALAKTGIQSKFKVRNSRDSDIKFLDQRQCTHDIYRPVRYVLGFYWLALLDSRQPLFIHASDGRTDRQTDRQTELRQQYRALHYMQSHGKNGPISRGSQSEVSGKRSMVEKIYQKGKF